MLPAQGVARAGSLLPADQSTYVPGEVAQAYQATDLGPTGPGGDPLYISPAGNYVLADIVGGPSGDYNIIYNTTTGTSMNLPTGTLEDGCSIGQFEGYGIDNSGTAAGDLSDGSTTGGACEAGAAEATEDGAVSITGPNFEYVSEGSPVTCEFFATNSPSTGDVPEGSFTKISGGGNAVGYAEDQCTQGVGNTDNSQFVESLDQGSLAPTNLNDTLDPPVSDVEGINDSGTMVGDNAEGIGEATGIFEWTGDNTPSEVLPGFFLAQTDYANQMNNLGDVLIHSTSPLETGLYQASSGTVLPIGTDLPLYPGWVTGFSAQGLNDSEVVVGTADKIDDAYAWSQSTGSVDISKLITNPTVAGIVDLTTAYGIGDNGDIVALGTSPTDGQEHDYLLTPVDPPVVSGVTLDHGSDAGNTAVTISGSGFSTGASTVTVNFTPQNGAATQSVTGTVVNDSTVTASTPNMSGEDDDLPLYTDVTVTVGDVTSAVNPTYDTYRFDPPGPQVLSLSQASGPSDGGTSLAITGTSFGPPGGTDTVSFVPIGGAATQTATGTVVNDTTVTTTTPNMSSELTPGVPLVVDVEVTTNEGTSPPNPPGDRFSFDTLAVDAVTQPTGPAKGDTSIVISGSGFLGQDLAGASAVVFVPSGGGTPIAAKSFTTVNDNTIDAVTPKVTKLIPPGQPDLVTDVEVTVDGSTSPLNPPGDTYVFGLAPIIKKLNPVSGPLSGKVTVKASGYNLKGATIAFGSAGVTASCSNTTCSMTAPPAPGGVQGQVDVVATNQWGSSPTTTSDDVFEYDAPTLVATPKPSDWPSKTVEVTGSNWDPTTTVSVTFDDGIPGQAVTQTIAPNSDGTIKGKFEPIQRTCGLVVTAQQASTGMVTQQVLPPPSASGAPLARVGQVDYAKGDSTINGGPPLKTNDYLCTTDLDGNDNLQVTSNPGGVLLSQYVDPGFDVSGTNLNVSAAGSTATDANVDFHGTVCVDLSRSASVTDTFGLGATDESGPCPAPQPGGGINISPYNPVNEVGIQTLLPTADEGIALTGVNQAPDGLTVTTGGMLLNGGILYVTGNLVVDGGVTGNGVIFVTGTATINGPVNVALNSGGPAGIVCVGGVVLNPAG
jgi:IPT/TIG domain